MTVRVTRLDNGLTVATDPMQSVETCSLGVWVGVGTRHETAELNGIAHLLEHMAFKGTERRSARDIAEQVEAVGGHLNAYTSRESTAFYAKVLAEDTALALDVISDILQFSTFEDEELTRERAVVLQEIGQSLDTPDDIIFDHFQEVAYPSQAIGRPVLGRAEIVSALGRDNLRGYMGMHYSPNRMILAAAGRVDHDILLEMVVKAFTALPENRPPKVEAASYQGGEVREKKDLEQVHVVLGFDALGYRDPEYYTALMLSTLFGGGMSSRLFQEVREKRGLVYSIYSFLSSYNDGGIFGIYAGTGEREIEELIAVVCDEFGKLAEAVSEEEIARARAQIKASTLMARESNGARAEQAAQQILAYGQPLTVEEILSKIERVDAAAIKRLAARFGKSRPTLAAIGPIDRLESYDRLVARLG